MFFVNTLCDYADQVRVLASTGGSTVPEAVRRVLKKLMTTGVAVHLNWKGTRGKLGLSTLDLKNVLFGRHCLFASFI